MLLISTLSCQRAYRNEAKLNWLSMPFASGPRASSLAFSLTTAERSGLRLRCTRTFQLLAAPSPSCLFQVSYPSEMTRIEFLPPGNFPGLLATSWSVVLNLRLYDPKGQMKTGGDAFVVIS